MPGSSRLIVLGACCLLQGAAVRLARQAPEVAKVLQLSREAEKAIDGGPLRQVGPFAVSSNSIAARLPSSKASKAWGDDKLKTMSVVGAKDGDFSAGVFGSAGTDATKVHALYGGGYKGLKGSNGGLPSKFGVLGVAKADPGSLEVVHAIPSEKGGLDYGQLKLAVTKGHLSPEQLWGQHLAASEGKQDAAEAERMAAAQKAQKEQWARAAAEEAAATEGRKRLEQEMAQARENQRVWSEEAAGREAAEAEQAAQRKAAEEAAEAARKRAAEEAAAQAARMEEERQREAAERAAQEAKELVKRAAEEEERKRAAAQQKAEEEKAATLAEEAMRKLAQKAREDAKKAAEEQAATAAQATTSPFPPADEPPSKDWLKKAGEAMKDLAKTSAPQQAAQAEAPGGDFLKKIADALSKKPTPEQLEKRKQFLKSLGVGEPVKPPTAEQIEKGKEFFKKLAGQKAQAKDGKKSWSVFPNANNNKPGQDLLKKIQEAMAAAAKPAGRA